MQINVGARIVWWEQIARSWLRGAAAVPVAWAASAEQDLSEEGWMKPLRPACCPVPMTTIALLGTIALGIAPALAQQGTPVQGTPPTIEQKVVAILRAACETLSSAKTMSFTAVDTYERAARNGQPLYYTVMDKVILQRPDKLRVTKIGDGVPDEFYYDGKTVMAYVPSADLVAIADAPPDIDQMLDAAWDLGSIYFPFSDVILSKPCAVFDQKMKSAFYVGQSVVVGGTTTDMVAVAGDDVQAELWIGAADHLPRMIRVVYPDEPAHAHYQTEYSDWKLGGEVGPEVFTSAKAVAARRIPFQPPEAGSTPSEVRPGAVAGPKKPP
jgi:hypothetical protein